ncbi:MAG: redoxin domain-containing protein [Actinomycetota bacterium]
MQVVDLQKDKDFQALGVELVSIAPDSQKAWRSDGREWELTDYDTVLTDADNQVADSYGVLRWAHPITGEPGHTFVLVDESGTVSWVKDYGGEENGSIMYVVPDEIVKQLHHQL